MSNRSKVTAGFVKTFVCTVLENEGCKNKWTKKMGGIFNVQKHEKCSRKGVCFIHDLKNTRLGSVRK